MSDISVPEPSAKLKRQITRESKKVGTKFETDFSFLEQFVTDDYNNRTAVVVIAKGLADLSAQRAEAKAGLLQNKVYCSYKERYDQLHALYIKCPTFEIEGVKVKRPSPMGDIRTALDSMRKFLRALEDAFVFDRLNEKAATFVEQLVAIPKWEKLLADIEDNDLRNAVEIEVKRHNQNIQK